MAAPARATLVDVTITGTLDNGSSTPDQAAIFAAGASLSGTLRIDLDTPVGALVPGFGNHDLARYFDAIVSSSFTINGVDFDHNPAGVNEAALLDFSATIPGPSDPDILGDQTRLSPVRPTSPCGLASTTT